jgi:hypothetical protein
VTVVEIVRRNGIWIFTQFRREQETAQVSIYVALTRKIIDLEIFTYEEATEKQVCGRMP